MARQTSIRLLAGGVVLLLGILLFGVSGGLAGGAQPVAPLPQVTPNPDLSIPNEVCLGCHNNPNLVMELGNGEVLGLFVPESIYKESVHGQEGYGCVQCHRDVGNYPHPPFNAENPRDVSMKLVNTCRYCHQSFFDKTEDSVHQAALESGNLNAAICTDCHTSHAVRRLTNPETGQLLEDSRQWIPQTCAKCHYAIYQKYSTSVHGAALLTEGNPDVPTCIDCHGVHSIEDPTTAAFRLRSPKICADCHTDPKLMGKYGISTDVLSTYVADFHGTTWAIFERQHPDQETNKPVCYDCHGVHDIKSVDDPVAGLSIQENLLKRCQVCHPQATINFPTAWLSHYIPSPNRYPLVYVVNLFYKIFIPTVLGGMFLLVVLDVGSIIRGLTQRIRKKNHREDKVNQEKQPEDKE